MILKEGVYYQLRSPYLTWTDTDVEDEKRLTLRREDVVLCTAIVHRSGKSGRGRYARFLHQDADGETRVLFHRVSRTGRGAGEWSELNPMIVLARAAELPTL